MVSPKVLFLVLSCLFCALFFQVPSSLNLLFIIICMLMTLSLSLLSLLTNSLKMSLENTIVEVSSWMSANLLMLNPSKTELLLVGLPKIEDPSLSRIPTFFHHLILPFHVRDLECLRPILDQTTDRVIPTALYCNSLFLNLPAHQLDRLQLVVNFAAGAVTNTPKFHHKTPVLKFLHCLKISERIHYKILFITYICLLSDEPAYLQNL
jgi:hypothetical protein